MKERRGDWIPKLTAAATTRDVRALPLGPTDGFILSRIDGMLSEDEIATLTGLDDALVRSTLDRLAGLGLLEPPPHGVHAIHGQASPSPTSPPSARTNTRPPSGSTHAAAPVSSKPPGSLANRSVAEIRESVESFRWRPSTPVPAPNSRSLSPYPPPARPSAGPNAPGAAATPSSGTYSSLRPPADPDAAPRPASARPQAAPSFRAVASSAPPGAAAPSAPPGPGAAASSDEDVDLEPAHRARILELHASLDAFDHYRLLGVERTADKKTIKRAYYDLAALFHPDRFFRKKLGSYKPKMEAIFGRITQAHDALTSPRQRSEYDTYLEALERSRGIEAMLDEALAEIQRAETELLGAVPLPTPPAPQPVSDPSPPPAGAPTTASPAPLTPPAASSAATGSAERSEERRSHRAPTAASATNANDAGAAPRTPNDKDVRDALARRLLGARRPIGGPVASATSKPPSPSTTPDDAMAALRRRYDERLDHARAAQTRKYIGIADAAKAQGDMVAAANALKVALRFNPQDEELRAACDEASRQADRVLTESYLRQAEYEEKNQQWPAAARSWAKVAKARPDDAHANERAANALIHASGNLHEAGEFAKRACALVPTEPKYRLTLAQIYIGAGLTLNAKRELEHANSLSPGDPLVQNLLRRLPRGA